MNNLRIKLVIAVIMSLFILGGCNFHEKQSTEYMVLIGEESSVIGKIKNVDLLIIDAEYFTAEEIDNFKKNNVKEIYSYLNIGSIESFRSYYDEYEAYTLGAYDNWPKERWIDVSSKDWQTFISNRINELSQKGVDGFFIDNTDVYYVYPKSEIYTGLVDILSEINKSNKSVIVNGGDYFVKTYIESGNKTKLFDGVNQEGVYTHYDFSKQKCTINNKNTTAYYTEYLDMLLQEGYRVYVLEYATDANIKNKAYMYSNNHNYTCYVSDNIELKYSSTNS